ncbi:MAG TPA: MarR family transcriptional regulator [Tepidisphaeraceae bacterium]|jgi:DNA-binding MarR family transcriptional regulator|nr:MarR family transcriptional regulator [Tepidisphaeraceae bacterium]
MIRLKDEKSFTKPAPLLEQEVFMSLQRNADWLMRELEEILKDDTLSPAQYNVLRILRTAGPVGMACHEIGERMITRDPDMTRLLDRLEDRDLVVRARERQDRRVIRIRVSPTGLKLLKELDEPVRSLHRRQLGHLSEKRLSLLVRLLESVREQTIE